MEASDAAPAEASPKSEVGASSRQLYDELRLQCVGTTFVITPTNAPGAPSLVLNRLTGEISLSTEAVPPSSGKVAPLMLYGILGFVDLLAGRYAIVVSGREEAGEIDGKKVYKASFNILSFAPSLEALDSKDQKIEKTLIAMLQDVLQTPMHLVSYDYDLTRSLQTHFTSDEASRGQPCAWRQCDERFVWNYSMLMPMIEHSASSGLMAPFILPVVHGFIQQQSFRIKGIQVTTTLLSRRSRHRAGSRFYARGIDRAAHVANFVETEQIVEQDSNKASFLQIRGSIPLFWNQPPGVNMKPKPVLHRSLLKTFPLFCAHLQEMVNHYQKVVLVDLVDQTGAEAVIGNCFGEYVGLLDHPSIRYVPFDFHTQCKATSYDKLSVLFDEVVGDVDSCGCFLQEDGQLVLSQVGVLRTNCIDCLDRTNVVQTLVARHVLECQLRRFKLLLPSESIVDGFSEVEALFKDTWANHADVISLQYAGTEALKNDFTRTGKRSMLGLINDGLNTASRIYKSHFKDEERQDAIDLVQGLVRVNRRLDPSLEAKVLSWSAKKIEHSGYDRAVVLVVSQSSKEVSYSFGDNDSLSCKFSTNALVRVEREGCTLYLVVEPQVAAMPMELVLSSTSEAEWLEQALYACRESSAPEPDLLLPSEVTTAHTETLSVYSVSFAAFPGTERLQELREQVDGWELIVLSWGAVDGWQAPVQQLFAEVLAVLGEGYRAISMSAAGCGAMAVFQKQDCAEITAVRTNSLLLYPESNNCTMGALLTTLSICSTTFTFVACHLPKPVDQVVVSFVSSLIASCWDLEADSAASLPEHLLLFGFQIDHSTIRNTGLLSHFDMIPQPGSCAFHLSTLRPDALDTRARGESSGLCTAVGLKLMPLPVPSWDWVCDRSRATIVLSAVEVSVSGECASKPSILRLRSSTLFHGEVCSDKSSTNLPTASWSCTTEVPCISGEMKFIRCCSVSGLLWEHHTISGDRSVASFAISLENISDTTPTPFQVQLICAGYAVGTLSGVFQVLMPGVGQNDSPNSDSGMLSRFKGIFK